MGSTNRFPGLARGPIDHQSSSVINLISKGTIVMGDVVALDKPVSPTPFDSKTILPQVTPSGALGTNLVYGIAVGGDVDGIYGDGQTVTDDKFRATNGAGQGVVVVTQGRCLARVNGNLGTAVFIGDKLVMSATSGELQKAAAPGTTATIQFVIATALQSVTVNDVDMIAVDVQREGGNSIS